MLPEKATYCLRMMLRRVSDCVILSPMETQSYYLTKIKEGLSIKQRQNPHYSMRAYARDIGVHPATLSQILKGKRPLPVKDSQAVVAKLNLSPKEKALFIQSLLQSKSALDHIKTEDWDKRILLDESNYKIIAEWEHYAVLELFDVLGFECSIDEVAQRLDITANRAEVVLENLMNSGLLKMVDGKYERLQADVKTTEDMTSQALRDSHKETLDMAKRKLEEVEVELRDFSSHTLALDLRKLPEAKAIIREFRQKMSALAEEGDKTDVYILAIQLFPVTHIGRFKN